MSNTEDVRIVVRFLTEQYGRRGLDHIASPTRLATAIVGDLAKAERLGDAPAVAEGWEPPYDDVDDFGGPLANHFGMMRLWRAEEIGHYALIALARAGRLLPRGPGPRPVGERDFGGFAPETPT